MSLLFQIKNIALNYGELNILNDFSMEDNGSQFICLLGSSGIGKTSILNIISGLIKPVCGSVFSNNKRIAYVFQEPRLLPWMTVEENIEIGLFAIDKDSRSRKQAVKKIIKKIGLENFAKYYPEQLSGGMKQRVSIGRAFVTKPELLLLDEPFSGLDDALKTDMQDLLLTLEDWHLCTTIMVTHDIQEAITLANRIILVAGRPCRIILDMILGAKEKENIGYRNSLEKKILNYLY